MPRQKYFIKQSTLKTIDLQSFRRSKGEVGDKTSSCISIAVALCYVSHCLVDLVEIIFQGKEASTAKTWDRLCFSTSLWASLIEGV